MWSGVEFRVVNVGGGGGLFTLDVGTTLKVQNNDFILTISPVLLNFF